MALLRRILGLIVIVATASALAAASCAACQQPIRATQQAVATLLDINTATPEQLNALPGMGAAYTRRLIAGRPYTAKNQLVTRGVLPQEAYEKFQNRVVARRTTK